jgi:small GTP-binding protein
MVEGQKFRYKISVEGDNRVGKRSLMKRFTHSAFEKDHLKTIGIQSSKYEIKIDSDEIRLVFSFINPDEEFQFLSPTFFRETNAAIIVCSIEGSESGNESINNIPKWCEKILKYCGDVPIYLFANKVDLVDKEEVDEARLQILVEEYNLKGYYLTSSVEGGTVMRAFKDISMVLYTIAKKRNP